VTLPHDAQLDISLNRQRKFIKLKKEGYKANIGICPNCHSANAMFYPDGKILCNRCDYVFRNNAQLS